MDPITLQKCDMDWMLLTQQVPTHPLVQKALVFNIQGIKKNSLKSHSQTGHWEDSPYTRTSNFVLADISVNSPSKKYIYIERNCRLKVSKKHFSLFWKQSRWSGLVGVVMYVCKWYKCEMKQLSGFVSAPEIHFYGCTITCAFKLTLFGDVVVKIKWNVFGMLSSIHICIYVSCEIKINDLQGHIIDISAETKIQMEFVFSEIFVCIQENHVGVLQSSDWHLVLYDDNECFVKWHHYASTKQNHRMLKQDVFWYAMSSSGHVKLTSPIHAMGNKQDHGTNALEQVAPHTNGIHSGTAVFW